MLPAAARMRSSAEFAATTCNSTRAATHALVLHARLVDPVSPVRVGFVVSRQVGGSVERNRLLRRLRHLMRDRVDRLPAGTSLVVRANVGAAPLGSAELGRCLDDALGRVLR